jgi:predicted  nucleic acid-binding Zn-ribbon protein
MSKPPWTDVGKIQTEIDSIKSELREKAESYEVNSLQQKLKELEYRVDSLERSLQSVHSRLFALEDGRIANN